MMSSEWKYWVHKDVTLWGISHHHQLPGWTFPSPSLSDTPPSYSWHTNTNLMHLQSKNKILQIICLSNKEQDYSRAVHLIECDNTQSCVHNRRWISFDYEREIALLVSDLRLCVLTAAPSESRWWRFTANHGTGFTEEMRMIIAFD